MGSPDHTTMERSSQAPTSPDGSVSEFYSEISQSHFHTSIILFSIFLHPFIFLVQTIVILFSFKYSIRLYKKKSIAIIFEKRNANNL